MTYKLYDISYEGSHNKGLLSGSYYMREGTLEKYYGYRFCAYDVLGEDELSFTWPYSDKLTINESDYFHGVDFSPVFKREKSDIIFMGGFEFLDWLEPNEDECPVDQVYAD